jgi:transcriptional regulator with XRE-family HTH domain
MSLLKTLRERAGMTQAQLAALVGCHQSHICKAESGVRLLSVTSLHRILAVLGASPDERSEALAQAAGDDPAAPAVAA